LRSQDDGCNTHLALLIIVVFHAPTMSAATPMTVMVPTAAHALLVHLVVVLVIASPEGGEPAAASAPAAGAVTRRVVVMAVAAMLLRLEQFTGLGDLNVDVRRCDGRCRKACEDIRVTHFGGSWLFNLGDYCMS
jgi:hypothetical protein